MKKFYPKISVVIPSYNQGCYIEETILSILNQKYPKLELIIIDGKSTDNTLDVIKKYYDFINYFVSEEDKGQADALNKGFAIATGDICAYLNSDDVYLDNIFWKISELYLKENFKWICSDILIGYSKKESKVWEAKITSFESFCVEQTIGQQGVFWVNNCFNKPWFEENLKYVLDHKFFISLYKKFGPPNYLKAKGSFFRLHKNSKTSRFEDILFKERKLITLQAVDKANSKYQRRRIILEMKRLELKIEINKKFSTISKNLKYKYRFLFFVYTLLIFMKAPLKFKDKFFLGYIKKSFNFLR